MRIYFEYDTEMDEKNLRDKLTEIHRIERMITHEKEKSDESSRAAIRKKNERWLDDYWESVYF